MKLDPSSRTLITDWASGVLGDPMPGYIVDGMNKWLVRRMAVLQARQLRIVRSPVADVTLLLKVSPGPNTSLFAIYRDGQTIQLSGKSIGLRRSNQQRLMSRINDHVFHLEQQLNTQGSILDPQGVRPDPHRPAPLVTFPMASSERTKVPKLASRAKAYGLAREARETLIGFLLRPHGATLSRDSRWLLTAGLTELATCLRKALRAPDVQLIGRVLQGADREALAVLRRQRNFDMRLYGYMTSSNDPEIRKRRRQLVQTFPILASFTFMPGLAVKQFRIAVDQGVPLLHGSGLATLAAVLTEQHHSRILPRTAAAYVRLGARRSDAQYLNAITENLGALDLIDPKFWPGSAAEIGMISSLIAPVQTCEPVARRLTDDTGADWKGLYTKAHSAVQQRMCLAVEDQLYRSEQSARAKSLPIEYLRPYPLPPADLQLVHQRVTDYTAMIVRETIRPAHIALTGHPIHENDLRTITNTVMASAPYRQLIEASEKWHEPRRLRRIKAELAALTPGLNEGWLPLVRMVAVPDATIFEGRPIGGMNFSELTTASKLATESDEMGHCVHSYVDNCLRSSKACHIFSIRNKDGRPASTLDLQETGESKNPVTVAMNLTYGDNRPSKDALAAGNWLAMQINRGQIKPDYSLADRDERRALLRSEVEARSTYVAADPALMQAAFDILRHAVFPPAWKQYNTPAAFLTTILQSSVTAAPASPDIITTDFRHGHPPQQHAGRAAPA